MALAASSVDRSQLEQVYRRYHPFVWRSVRRLGVEEASVDDAVHEVFIVVSRRLAEFEGRADLRTWLFAIALRVVQNHRRALWRHRRRAEAVGEVVYDASDKMARSEAAMTLHRMLADLPEEHRAAYILAELDGCSAPEIAEALDVNVNTIYARIRRARQLMHAAASRLEEEAP